MRVYDVILGTKGAAMEHQLGNRIRNFRERLGFTQADLAKLTGLDLPLIAAIENGEVYPALGILVRLARGLGQRLGTFMDDQLVTDPLIVRTKNRKSEMAHHKATPSRSYRYFSMGSGKTDRHMEPFFIEIDPAQEKVTSSHEGEEFVFVVAGEIELLYGKRKYLLKPGDSTYYNSIVPHCISAVGGLKAEVCAVLFMPF
jgi:transcriptional regulator with XRE-family HTH domain